MKLKYIGIVPKTVNYSENKYLYLIPGKEYEIGNGDFGSERIRKLIKNHELKIIEIAKVNTPVVVDPPLKIDIPINMDIKKESKRKKNKRKKIKDFLKSHKGGK